MDRHIGEQTVCFKTPPVILSAASVVGPKEGEGPLARYFDRVLDDFLAGKETWEQAESDLARQGIELAVAKAGLSIKDIQYILAGDLLNQEIGSTYGIRSMERPFFGLFGACSTIGEAMTIGSVFVDGGFADHIVAAASSHFGSAEKTFRLPMELGNQRTLTASWTVTGDGAMVIGAEGEGPRITAATTGRIVDMGIKDATHMGAAMAPAAADLLIRHFQDMNIGPDEYDLIVTGDLGHFGLELLRKLMSENGYDISGNSTDCGVEIFDKDTQDTH
ncbi:MAG: stage V sporulation protein AD, partial [Clostridiales bacterium]|nr:stage V sporulation protein AD [Clostridiales bacterium]